MREFTLYESQSDLVEYLEATAAWLWEHGFEANSVGMAAAARIVDQANFQFPRALPLPQPRDMGVEGWVRGRRPSRVIPPAARGEKAG